MRYNSLRFVVTHVLMWESKGEAMKLTDYGRILVRRGWIILLLALLTGSSAYGFSRFLTPTYRATQIVLVQPSRNDFGLAEATVRLLNSYKVYLDSREIAQQVINTLSLDMTSDALKADVTIVPNRDNLTIQIDVDSEDPVTAERVARAWGQVLVDYRFQQNQTVRREDRIDAIMTDSPRVELLQPRPTLNAVAGVVLGMLLGGIIIFVLEYLESSFVRSRDDLERGLDMAVLAAVPRTEG
jgi:capsular polysaccharide biosynthesis protein